jgi:hypothetical protein
LVTARRFPPPWTAEVTPNCFIVRDANGQALSYVYYESEPGRRSAAKLLSKDEARRIAANIAKLPGLFREPLARCAEPRPNEPPAGALRAAMSKFCFATALVRLRHLRAGSLVAPLARCVALHAVRGDQRAAPLGVCGV